MKIATICFLLILPSAVLPATEDISYEIDAVIDMSSYSLSGTVRIEIGSRFYSSRDSLVLTTRLDSNQNLKISDLKLDGKAALALSIPGAAAVELTPSQKNTSSLVLTCSFELNEVQETEGLIFFNDQPGEKLREAWYPHLKDATVAAYSIKFSVTGSGHAAMAGEDSQAQTLKSGIQYLASSDSATAFPLVISPIFAEKRVSANDTDIGAFVREGSLTSTEKILITTSEIVAFYSSAIPEYLPGRLDIVLYGGEPDKISHSANLVLIHDDIDQMVEEYGSVFVSNYLRWKISIALARSWFYSVLPSSGKDIPWLQEGLALLYAEKYAKTAMLGGPAFDNIRQYYLTEANKKEDLSLDQGIENARSNNIDILNVLARSKGFWAVSTLEKLLAKQWKPFLRAVQEKAKTASVNDAFQQAVSATGLALADTFTREWIFGSAMIDYKIDRIDRRNGRPAVEIVNSSTINLPADVEVTFADNSRKTVSWTPSNERQWVEFDNSEELVRVRIDPGYALADVNRANNVRSLRGSERIELLYSIDSILDIGDIQLEGSPVRTIDSRSARYSFTISNKKESTIYLGVRFTAMFPGGRNKGITSQLFELSANETRSIVDVMALPLRGKGLLNVQADFFLLSRKEKFNSITKNTKPSLTNNYVFEIRR